MPSIQCAPPLSREEYSYMAMVAEEAERFDEMGRIIEEMVRRTSSLGEFRADERNLIAVAHKKMVDGRRASWRRVASIESDEIDPKLVKGLRERIEAELDEICSGIISLLGSHLIPSSSSSEAKVFFLKMKGDYHRYLAEFKDGDRRKNAALSSIEAYKAAEDIALEHLSPTNPTRLGLALNFSVFCFEILNLSENARQIARQAFKEAIGELDKLAQEPYTHARLQLQSLRENLTLWNYDNQVHAYYRFGPLSAYLAVNYLDRFLSSYELPKEKAWMTHLLSVACLSLACKMEEIEVPLLLDLQVGETKFVFEARTIQRMELLLLSTLKWRMQAVTPFSFIDYFLHKLNGDNSPSKISVARAVELIVCTIQCIDFLEFRPSEIAAGVALSVLGKAQPLDVMEAIAYCNKLDKERVLRCYEVIQEEIINCCEDPMSGFQSVLSLPQSPIGVLDAACLSYKNDELASGSQSSRHISSPAAKRRKKSRSSTSLCGRETPF